MSIYLNLLIFRRRRFLVVYGALGGTFSSHSPWRNSASFLGTADGLIDVVHCVVELIFGQDAVIIRVDTLEELELFASYNPHSFVCK